LELLADVNPWNAMSELCCEQRNNLFRTMNGPVLKVSVKQSEGNGCDCDIRVLLIFPISKN